MKDNRSILRASTQRSHALSEQHWVAVFAHPQGTRQFLEAMEILHLRFGVIAAQRSGRRGAIETEQERLMALQQDLGRTANALLPADRTVDRDAAWGMLYVLNGSALGAATLLRPGAPLAGQRSTYLETMRAFASSGAFGGFIRALNSQTLDMARAVAGADRVFAAMSGLEFRGKEYPCQMA